MIRATLNRCWTLVALTIIVMALLLSSARLLLPYLDTFHQQIEETISRAVGAAVEVNSMETAWHGTGPQLKLRGVRVLSGERELLRFERGRVGLDLWQSLIHGKLQIGSLVVSGVGLTITHDESGKIGVAGFEAVASSDNEEERAQRQSAHEQALMQWLFSQPYMVIEESEISWRDLTQAGRELHFSNVTFELRNQGGRHQLDGAAELPVHLGRTLSFALDIEGDLHAEQGWRAQGYVEGGDLQLAQWLAERTPLGLRVDEGLVETRLWFEWEDNALQRAEGDFSLRQLHLTPVKENSVTDTRKSMVVDLLSGTYLWQQNGAGWGLAVDNFLLGRDNSMWPPSQLSVVTSKRPDGEQVVEATLGYARIDDLNALLQMSNLVNEAARQKLLAFAPTGELREGYLHFRNPLSDTKQDYHYALSARFDALGVNAVGKLPGLSGVSGHARLDSNGGYLALERMHGEVSIPAIFRAPLAVSTLEGDIYWQSKGDAWQVEARELKLSNSDAQLTLALALEKGLQAPEIALLAEFNAPSVANISGYLPAGIMPQGSVKWLDRAIVNGNASAGQVILYGPLDHHFPYENSDGLFDIRFNLTDGILDYAPGWPRLEEMEAEVIFTGSGMQINAVAAKSLDADVTQVSARIQDLRVHPALLEIDGKARGHARDALDFVQRSPLNKSFGAFVEGAEVTAGRSKLELSLKLPLADLPAEVAGVVSFDAADFYLADRAVDILDVNGELKFTEKGVEIERMQAHLLGMKSQLKAKTSTEGVTVMNAVGNATAADIQRLLPNPLLQPLEGEAAWQAQLTIPAAASGSSRVDLKVKSDLVGMAAPLPYPLGKSAAVPAALVLETAFPQSLNVPLTLEYGSELQAVFDLDEKMALQRGAITLGGAAPVMPEQALISVAGRLSHLSLEAWMPLIETASVHPEAGEVSTGTAAEIEQLNLEITALEALGYEFHHTSLALTKEQAVWQGTISNHLMGGELQIPADFEHGTLVMALDYLVLPAAIEDENSADTAEQTAAQMINPQRLPAMNINSRYFNFAGLPLGSLTLLAAKRPAGLHIEQLQLASSLMALSLQGDWVMANSRQHSSFNIKVNSKNLGEMLSMLNITDSIREGESDIGIVARWPGAPTAFALERLSGNMHLNVKDGRLLEVEPGAGRVFGLISLQSLRRRFTLDFSDMFKKGFSFNRMTGDFEINNGDATTSNFSIVGPSASITMSGRVGLVVKDYDQYVTVEPHVGSSLPVIGAVVGTVATGVAIWVAQKLLNLNEVVQVKYRVVGPWDAPQVTREEITVLDDSSAEK